MLELLHKVIDVINLENNKSTDTLKSYMDGLEKYNELIAKGFILPSRTQLPSIEEKMLLRQHARFNYSDSKLK